MSVVLMLSTLPIVLMVSEMRSNLTFYLILVMIISIVASLAKHKWIAIIPLTIQGAISIGMVCMRLLGYTESNYFLYVSAISATIIISTIIEMRIEKKEAKKVS